MPVVIFSARVYRRVIDELTTPTDRLIHADTGKRLPDGRVEYNMPDDLAEALREFMFEGESYPDAIERLLAVAGRQVS